MAKKLYPEEDVQAIANAIRAKNGASDTYTIGQMASAINNLPSGGDDILKTYIGGTILSIDIPNGTTKIRNSAFRDLATLEEVNIHGTTVASIGADAFRNASHLEQIHITEGVTTIGTYAFGSCSALQEVDLPSTLTNINNNAFANCSALTKITSRAIAPPTLSGASVFNNVPATANIYVPAASVEAYKSASNWSSRASYIQAISE